MKYRNALLIVFLVILVDQISKIYVKTHFFYNQEFHVLGSWFRIHFLENEGMAFGMKLSEGSIGKLLLSLFRLAAVGVLFYVLKVVARKGYSRGAIVCGSLILAGALGNLIDSMFYGLIFSESSFHVAKFVPFGTGYGSFLHGRVVDMLYFPLFRIDFPQSFPLMGGKSFEFFEPVFNIADAAISTGVITLLLFQKKLLTRQELPAATISERQTPETESAE